MVELPIFPVMATELQISRDDDDDDDDNDDDDDDINKLQISFLRGHHVVHWTLHVSKQVNILLYVHRGEMAYQGRCVCVCGGGGGEQNSEGSTARADPEDPGQK